MTATRKKSTDLHEAKPIDQYNQAAQDVTLDSPIAKQALEQIKSPQTAQDGWGRLYGLSAAYLQDGKALPLELSQLMAARLQAVSSLLLSNTADMRKDLPDAVMTKTRRSRGRPAMKNRERIADLILVSAFEKKFASTPGFIHSVYRQKPQQKMRMVAVSLSNEDVVEEAITWYNKNYLSVPNPQNEDPDALIRFAKDRHKDLLTF